jgi:hypothetical protein
MHWADAHALRTDTPLLIQISKRLKNFESVLFDQIENALAGFFVLRSLQRLG